VVEDATDVRREQGGATPLQRWSHALFGYDVFISYRRGDASTYAATLALKLHERHDLVVFLDDQELDAGEQLPALLRAVRRSRMLVVLVTPNVAQSLFVPREVATARAKGRRIVPIDFDRTLEQDRQGEELGRLLQEEKWHSESGAIRDGPGHAVLDAIVRSRRGLKRRVQQRLFFALIVLVLMTLTGYALRLAQQRADALAEQVVRTEHARRLAYGSQLLLASELVAREPVRARAVLDDEAHCPPNLRDVMWNLIADSCTREQWRSPKDWKPLRAAGFGASGVLSLDEDGGLRLTRLGASQKAEAVIATIPGTPLWVSAQSGRLVTLTAEGSVVIWDLPEGSERRRVEPHGAHRTSNNPEASADLFTNTAIIGAALSSSGRTLATMSPRTVRFWDVDTGAELTGRRFDVSNPGDQGPQDTLVAIHPSVVDPERFLLLLTRDLEDGYYRAVIFHTDADGTSRMVATENTARASGLVVARRGGRVAMIVRSTDAEIGLYAGYSRVLVFDGEGVGKPIFRHTIAQRTVTAADLDADGHRLVMATEPGGLRVVDAASGVLRADWATESSQAVAFNPSGTNILLLSKDGRASVHRIEPGRPAFVVRTEDTTFRLKHARSFQRHGDAIVYGWSALALDTLGGRIVVDRESGTAIGETRHYSADFLGQDYGIAELQTDILPGEAALAGGRKWLITLDSGRLDWSSLAEPTTNDRAPERSSGLQDRAARVELSPDGRHLAVLRLSDEVPEADSFDSPPLRKLEGPWVLEIVDAGNAATIARLWTGPGYPADLAWSHDSNWLALALAGGGVKMWRSQPWGAMVDVPTERRARLDFVRDRALLAAAWSTGAGPSTFAMIDPSRSRITRRASLHPRRVNVVRALSESRVAVGFDDGAVSVVDVPNEAVRIAAGPGGSTVTAIDASDDGKTLLVTRLRNDDRSLCTFADPEFGHDVLELRLDGEPVAAAAFLAGARGVVLATADGVYRWLTP
jgi:WD40 repeat protein